MTGIDSLSDGTYTAVVDSIEDGLATVFFEQDEQEVGHAVLDAATLPTAARHADAILAVTIVDGDLADAEYKPAETESRQEAAQDRFDRLSRRPPSDDDAS